MWAKLKKLMIPLCYALMVIPLVSVCDKMPNAGRLWADFAFLLIPCLMGYWMDAFLPKNKPIGLHMLFALLVGMIYAVGFAKYLGIGKASLAGITALVMMAGCDIACRRGIERAFPAYLIALSIIAYVVAYLFYLGTGRYFPVDGITPVQPIMAFGILWICIAVYIFNWQFVTRMSASRSHPKPPKKVMVVNLIASSVFSAVILLFTGFDWLRQNVSNIASAVWHWITAMFMKLNELAPQVEGEASVSVEEAMESMEGVEAIQRPEWFMTLVRYAMLGILFLAAAGALIFLGFQLRRLWRWFYRWIQRKLQNLQDEHAQDYVDETEDIRQESREASQNRFHVQQSSRIRMEDLPDNRAKVRYLYEQWIRSLKKVRMLDQSLTPNELQTLRAPNQEDMMGFVTQYNRARFSSHPIEDRAVTEGNMALKKLHVRR